MAKRRLPSAGDDLPHRGGAGTYVPISLIYVKETGTPKENIARGTAPLTPFSLGYRFFLALKRNGNNPPRCKRGKPPPTQWRKCVAYAAALIAVQLL